MRKMFERQSYIGKLGHVLLDDVMFGVCCWCYCGHCLVSVLFTVILCKYLMGTVIVTIVCSSSHAAPRCPRCILWLDVLCKFTLYFTQGYDVGIGWWCIRINVNRVVFLRRQVRDSVKLMGF